MPPEGPSSPPPLPGTTVQSPTLHDPKFRDASPDLWTRIARVLGAGIGGGLFVTVVGLLGHQVVTGEHWEVDQVAVAGNLQATDAAIRHLADIQPDAHLLAVDLGALAARVERHPWIRHVEVRRLLPGTLEVVVEEHEPALLLALDRMWLVDADGRPFKLARGEDLDHPVVTGIDQQLADLHPQLAHAVLQGALRVLDAAEGHPWVGPPTISELRFDDRLGFHIVTRTGTELILGFGAPDSALSRLDRLIEAGLDLSTPQRVDLDAGAVAIATPLPDPRTLTARP